MNSFKRNDILAILGQDNQFWVCKSLQNVNPSSKTTEFKAVWLETDDGVLYGVQDAPNMIPRESVIKRITMKRTSDPGFYEIPMRTKLKLLKELEPQDKNDKKVQKVKSKVAKNKIMKVFKEPKIKKPKIEKVTKPKKVKKVKIAKVSICYAPPGCSEF